MGARKRGRLARPTTRRLTTNECEFYGHLPKELQGRVKITTVPAIPGGYAGITLGSRVFLAHAVDPASFSELVAHELVHVQQWKDLGAFRFLWIYGRDFVHGLVRLRNWNAAYRAISL
ncbi:MAG: DUF4157 domain-containing protein [Acidimicrobiales bacterium]